MGLGNYDVHFFHTGPKHNTDINSLENSSDYRSAQFFINNTPEDFTVIYRNNLPLYISKASAGFQSGKEFCIRTNYHFLSHTRITTTITHLGEYIKNNTDRLEDLDILYKALTTAYQNDNRVSSITVTIDRRIDISAVKKLGSVYVPEVDLVLQVGQPNLDKSHPYSKDGRAKAEYVDFISEKKVSGILMELVDNDQHHKSRFLYAALQVIEIPSVQDKTRASGVYFSKVAYDSLGEIHIKPYYYTLEEAEKILGLYRTKDEAITGGNPEFIAKKLNQERDEKLTELKHDLDIAKSQMKLDELKRDQQLKETEHRLRESEHKLKMAELKAKEEEARAAAELEKERKETARLKEELDKKRDYRKDYFEERSYQRKDSSDLLKLLPVLITAALAVFTIITRKA